MSSDPGDMTKVYGALSNPVRRRIVEILKTQGKAGFKELHGTIGLSVGALYHHLDSLEGLVTQDQDKKYVLTERGRAAIEALGATEERINARGVYTVPETRLGFLSKELLFGRSLLQYFNQKPLVSIALAVPLMFFAGWASSMTNLEPLLLFYLNPSSTLSRTLIMFLFPLGWLATFATAEVLSLAIYHRRGGESSLLAGTAFAMLPLLIVPGVFTLARLAGSSFWSGNYLIVLLPILLQVWILCLLSSAISVSKGLKMEKTAVVSLGVVYVNILALITLLQLGF